MSPFLPSLRHAAPRVVLLVLGAWAVPQAHAADLSLGFVPQPGPGEKPALLLTPARAIAELVVSCEVGGQTHDAARSGLAAGKQERFEWPRDTGVTHADCFIRAVYPDGYVDELNVPIDWSYSASLSVDLSSASADVKARTLAVSVTAPVDKVDIKAIGAHAAVLDERTVELGAGPGDIEVPWVGEPHEVVLLDVTLHSGGAWAGFTYSPWFLDIPHEEVVFDTDSADIRADQEWKLEATLGQLNDVLDKYGEIVPVKVYIGGCTDTAGDGAHNRDLSRRRAKAIASWLREHGYDKPLFYYGFGEGLLSVQTGDGVDEQANRRVLYMVGANPPPRGSGVPSVSWIAL